MKGVTQAALGILAALGSSALVMGAFVLAFVESGAYLAWLPTQASPPTATTGLRPMIATSLPGEPTYTAGPTLAPLPTETFAAPGNCPPPAGWVAAPVTSDDTLANLAARYGIAPEALAASNCLPLINRLPDGFLYVPPPPTATASATQPPPLTPTDTPPPTATPVACGPFPGWVRYSVRSGDTLYSLAIRLGVTVPKLRQANCLGASNVILIGQMLYVPFIPPPVPTAPVPATAVPPTLALPPSLTPFVPTATLRPTNPPPPPTNTPAPPTSTSTPLPPTPTLVPPTSTSTALPPTQPQAPLTSTPLPPTNTPVPPTTMPLPPTPPDEPTPGPTQTPNG